MYVFQSMILFMIFNFVNKKDFPDKKFINQWKQDWHDKIMQTNIEGELLCVRCFLKFYIPIGQGISFGESVEMRSTMPLSIILILRNLQLYVPFYISNLSS